MSTKIGLHWFRRDLRIAGNAALQDQWKKYDGKVLGLFCFDSLFLGRKDFSHNRFAFFLQTLLSLRSELRELGSDLLVVDALPQEALPKILSEVEKSQKYKVETLSYSRDYEPFARERDASIEKLLASKVEIKNYRDHLIIEPQELFKERPGDFYQVYSPFAKKWFTLFSQENMQQRVRDQKSGLQYLTKKNHPKIFSLQWKDLKSAGYTDSLELFIEKNNKNVTIPIPRTGSQEVLGHLNAFKDKLQNYKDNRDVPSLAGTSKFSLFFKNGSLTTSQTIEFLKLHNLDFKTENSSTRFLKEIVWREFYYHILFHKPEVEKKSFLEKYENLNWENNSDWFQRWCDGNTGFPIVDAGMRELNTTGWMHNRVRMIVASFLCKDLLIDWRWGENYFMKMLLDGDLAPNNGGWQWAASTGCDPQPYFRIFNPWLQSAKFDPDATYIKKYIPELKNIGEKAIHSEDGNRGADYPRPMVEHSVQKNKALALYKA